MRATFHCVIKETTPPRRRRILSPLLRTSTHEAVAALFVKTVLLAVVHETAQDCVPGQNCCSRAEILSGTMFEHTRANQRAPNADRDNTAAHTHHHPHQHTSRTGHREQAHTRDPAAPPPPRERRGEESRAEKEGDGTLLVLLLLLKACTWAPPRGPYFWVVCTF